MAVLNLNDPVNGTTADATLIATNNAAVKSVVNGNLDNSNIVAGAGIVLSKLSGYPSDSTKFARGDGTWAVPVAAVGYSPPSPATSLPVSPADKDQAILVDSTSAPTYSWLLQYSSSASKWIFLGGSALEAEVATSEATSSTTYAALATAGPSVTLPRAGAYSVELGAMISVAATLTGIMSYDIGGTGALDVDSIEAGFTTAGFGSVSRQKVKTGLAASTTLTAKYKSSGVAASTYEKRWIRVTPITLT